MTICQVLIFFLAGQEEFLVNPAPAPRTMLAERLFASETLKKYRVSDFYYYESSGRVKGLALTNKMIIRFRPNFIGTEERAHYLQQFNSNVVVIENIAESIIKDAYVVKPVIPYYVTGARAVDFVLEKINQVPSYEMILLRGRATDVLPVVVDDGVEVTILDSIRIEVKSSVTDDLLRQRLESKKLPLGDFKVKTIIALPNDGQKTNRVFVVEFEDLTWPSNILALANLLSEQPWVNYAQPVFYEIERSDSIFFDIVPDGSPTLGEKRFLTLRHETKTGPTEYYRIDKDALPQIGRGDFVLTQQILNEQGSTLAVEIEEIFFKGGEPIITESEENGGRITTISWPFWVYATGAFVFKPVEIPLIAKVGNTEEKRSVRLLPGDVFVGSIISWSPQLIADIQPMKFYHLSKPVPIAEPTIAVVDERLTRSKYLGGVVAVWTAATLAVLWLVIVLTKWLALARLRWQSYREKRQIINALRLAVVEVLRDGDYKKAESALRQVMKDFFGLPYNTCARDLGDDTEERQLLLRGCLMELENRCVRDYAPSHADKMALADNLKLVADWAGRKK